MKIDFNKKILLGFLVNVLVVLVLMLIYKQRTSVDLDQASTLFLDVCALIFFLTFIALLTSVFFLIRNQISSRIKVNDQLTENKQLLQSIIDNSSNSIFVKRTSGEYLFVNKPFEKIVELSASEVLGKKDADLLDAQLEKQNKEVELKVAKEGRIIKTEEILHLSDGLHTFLTTRFPLFDFAGRIYAIGGISTDISEWKVLEESMHAGNKFFELSLDFLVIAGGGFFIKINPAFISFLGGSEKEILEKPFHTFVHPDDLESSRNELKKLATGINTVNYESRLLRKDGTYRWIRWVTSPDVTTGLLYAVGHDVTDRKKKEESLKVADRFFEISFDILTVVKGEHFIKVNKAFTRILGFDLRDIEKRTITSLAYPDDLNDPIHSLLRLQHPNSIGSFKARVQTRSGEFKWLAWTSSVDPNSGLVYAAAKDITEQVKLEKEQKIAVRKLYESEQKLKMVIDNIGEGVIVANKDKQIVMANLKAFDILNIEKEMTFNFAEELELYNTDETSEFPLQELPMERALKGELVEDLDMVLWDPKSEKKKRILMSGKPIFDQNNKVVAAVVSIRDISRYKELEKELRETEAKYRSIIGFKKENFTEPRIDNVEKPVEAKGKKPDTSE